MENPPIISIVKSINNLCSSHLKGAKCTDPLVCHGNCCYSSQEISKFLAEEYQKMHFIDEMDVIRSQQQVFRLKINPLTKRCIFFNIVENKCDIYTSRLIPPQCSTYPISTGKCKNKCRNNYIFELNESICDELDSLKKDYLSYTQIEYENEYTKDAICERFNQDFISLAKKIPPSKMTGIKDGLNGMKPITETDFSWDMTYFCDMNKACNQEYSSCPSICDSCLKVAIPRLVEMIYQYIQKNFARDEYFFQQFEFG